MAGLYIIDQDSGSSLIGREHVIVNRHEELYASRSREIGGLALVHIADDISLFAEITAAIDGQERHIDLLLAQALHQAIIDDRVAGMIDAHPRDFQDIAAASGVKRGGANRSGYSERKGSM